MRTSDNTNSLRTVRSLIDKTFEQTVDVDLNLPDYCFEIVRVLQCEGVPYLTRVQKGENGMVVDGYMRFCVLYTSKDNSQLHSYTHLQNFVKTIEVNSDFEDSLCDVSLKSEYVNVRATGNRNLSIKSAVSVHVRVLGIEQSEEWFETQSSDIQLKLKKVLHSSPVCFLQKQFVGELETEVNCETLADIVNMNAYCRVTEYKFIGQKLMVKGEIAVNSTILNRDGELHQLETKSEFSKFIQAETNDAKTMCWIMPAVTDCKEEYDRDDEDNSFVRFVVSCGLSVLCYETCETLVALDGYSTLYETESQYQTMTFETYEPAPLYTQNIEKRFVLDTSVRKITASWIQLMPLSEKSAACMARVTFVGEGDDDLTHVWCKNFDILPELSLSENSVHKFVSFQVQDQFVSWEQNSAVIAFKLTMQAVAVSSEKTKALTKLTCDDHKEKIRDKAVSLKIYYPSKREEVWDIAKRYSTTVQQIQQANSLTSDILDDYCALLIPLVIQ